MSPCGETAMLTTEMDGLERKVLQTQVPQFPAVGCGVVDYFCGLQGSAGHWTWEQAVARACDDHMDNDDPFRLCLR